MVNRNQAPKKVEAVSWPETIDLSIYPKDQSYPLADFDVLGSIEDTDYKDDTGKTALDIDLPFTERAEAAISLISRDQFFLEAFYDEPSPVELILDNSRRLVIADIFSSHGVLVEKNPDLPELAYPFLADIVNKLYQLDIEELFLLLVSYSQKIETPAPDGPPPAWIERSSPEIASNFQTIAGEEAYNLFSDLINVCSGQFGIGHVLRYVYFHRTEFASVESPFKIKFIAG